MAQKELKDSTGAAGEKVGEEMLSEAKARQSALEAKTAKARKETDKGSTH